MHRKPGLQRVARPGLAILAVGLLALGPGAALAREADPHAGGAADREELKDLMARRLEQVTGSRVRIQDLLYNLFTSTFTAGGIEAGPTASPFLKVGRVVLRAPLLGRGEGRGREVSMVKVQEVEATVPASWILRPYRRPSHQKIWVRRAEASNVRVAIQLEGGALELSRARLVLSDLTIPTARAGKAPAFRGQLQLRLGRVRAGDAALSAVVLRGNLRRTHLAVTHLGAGLPDGSLSLAGTVGFGGRRGIGPFALAGKIKLRVGGRAGAVQLEGPVKLVGQRLERLVLRGELRASGGKLPRQGGVDGAPALALRLAVPGQGVIRGTLRRWRLLR